MRFTYIALWLAAASLTTAALATEPDGNESDVVAPAPPCDESGEATDEDGNLVECDPGSTEMVPLDTPDLVAPPEVQDALDDASAQADKDAKKRKKSKKKKKKKAEKAADASEPTED